MRKIEVCKLSYFGPCLCSYRSISNIEEKNSDIKFEVLWFVLVRALGFEYESIESAGGSGSCDKILLSFWTTCQKNITLFNSYIIIFFNILTDEILCSIVKGFSVNFVCKFSTDSTMLLTHVYLL